MKIVVLNGSPKGDVSVTMQYVKFIQKKFPQHELKILNVCQLIKINESNDKSFQEIVAAVRSADGVLWAFSLYVFLVHSNYKKFIENIFENKVEEVFKNKFAAVLTTSIHFYDHTAHNYMHAICDDLNMKFVGSFSAGMYDLEKAKERERLILFANNLFTMITNNISASPSFKPVRNEPFEYILGNVQTKIDGGDKKILIVTDALNNQTNLIRMTERFKGSFSKEIEVINLNDIDIKGGCQGCIKCGYDNICAYEGKDGYIEFYNSKIKTADILIFAGTIKDRYLSSRWKLFFDRSFFNTHQPSLTGKQIGFIISGPLSQIPNLRQILEAYIELQGANLVDFITNECLDSEKIDTSIQNFTDRLIRYANQNYIQPSSFLGIGGKKLFRDEMWGNLRFAFQADHRYYKSHGVYDFPQYNYRTRITNTIMTLLTKIPSIRKEIYGNRMKEEMIKPLQKIVEKQ